MKECFGKLAGISIGYRDHLKQHFLRINEEKLKECDQCNLFNKCMFLKYNELFKKLLSMMPGEKGKAILHYSEPGA